MHYSNYIRTNCKPVENTPPVVVEAAIVEEETKPEETVQELQQKFPEVDPKDVVIPSSKIWQTQEQAQVHELKIPEEPKVNYNDPLLSDIHQFLANASKTDIVTKQNTRKLLKYLIDCMRDGMEESTTILTEDEANEVMEFLIELQNKYFDDIPLTENPSKLFIWNIPYDMYKGMKESINAGEPEIMNPMVTLYLSMTDFPKEATARYHQILDTLRYGHENDIRKSAQEYKEFMKPDEEELTTLQFEGNVDD